MAGLRELFIATALMMVVGIALLMTLVGVSPALGTLAWFLAVDFQQVEHNATGHRGSFGQSHNDSLAKVNDLSCV